MNFKVLAIAAFTGGGALFATEIEYELQEGSHVTQISCEGADTVERLRLSGGFKLTDFRTTFDGWFIARVEEVGFSATSDTQELILNGSGVYLSQVGVVFGATIRRHLSSFSLEVGTQRSVVDFSGELQRGVSLPLIRTGAFGRLSGTCFGLVILARPVGEQATQFFVRGDANGDSLLGVDDAIEILLQAFHGETSDCLDASDSDDDREIAISDSLSVLFHLFQGARPPGPAALHCGVDLTVDELPDCQRELVCESK